MASLSLSAVLSCSVRPRSLPAFARPWGIEHAAALERRSGVRRIDPAADVRRRHLWLFRRQCGVDRRAVPAEQKLFGAAGGPGHSRLRLSGLPERAAFFRALVRPRQPHATGEELEGVALQFLPAMRRAAPLLPMARRADPRREAMAGMRLPYACHVDDFTIQTRDGILLQFIELDGLAFETADSEEIDYRKHLRDGAFRALASSRFALYHHIVRREVAPALTGEFRDDFTRSLNQA